MDSKQTQRADSSTVNFSGRSGVRHRFRVWPFDTKFKPVGGVFLFTRRAFEDRTFTTKASHRLIAIGQMPNLAAPMITAAQRKQLLAQGANCVCVLACDDETRRREIEQDLIESRAPWGGVLQYLFHESVPEKAPGLPAADIT